MTDELATMLSILADEPDMEPRAGAAMRKANKALLELYARIQSLTAREAVLQEALASIRELVSDAIDRETLGAVVALDAIDDIVDTGEKP